MDSNLLFLLIYKQALVYLMLVSLGMNFGMPIIVKELGIFCMLIVRE